MAEALAKGFLSSGICSPDNIAATDINSTRLDLFRQMGCSVFESGKELV